MRDEDFLVGEQPLGTRDAEARRVALDRGRALAQLGHLEGVQVRPYLLMSPVVPRVSVGTYPGTRRASCRPHSR